jgi:hypothetical protein
MDRPSFGWWLLSVRGDAMTKYRISDQALKAMPEARRAEAMLKLVRDARALPNGELKDVIEQITDFERRFQLDSERMRAEVSDGTRREDWEICQWLMLMKRRSRLEQRASRAE